MDEPQLHINLLELRAGHLTPLHLEQDVLSHTILTESDNIVTVSNINEQVGVVSTTLNDETYMLFQWLISRSIMVRVIHRPAFNNELTDYLPHNHPDPTEWYLLERVVLQLFQWWRTPQMDLLASCLNHGQGCPFTPSLHYHCSKEHW